MIVATNLPSCAPAAVQAIAELLAYRATDEESQVCQGFSFSTLNPETLKAL